MAYIVSKKGVTLYLLFSPLLQKVSESVSDMGITAACVKRFGESKCVAWLAIMEQAFSLPYPH